MLKRNLIANYVGQAWTALMGLAFVPLYIKYLGIEAYGLIGIFALLQVWLTLLDMGMKFTLNREFACFTGGNYTVEYLRDLLRSMEVIAFAVATMIGVGIFFASNWIATSWLQTENIPIPVVTQAIAMMGVVTALRFIEGIYSNCLLGLQHQVSYNLITSGLATLRGLGAVAVLAWIAPTLQVFFLWQAFVSVITLVLFSLQTYATLPSGSRSGRFSFTAIKHVWRFAGAMAGIALMSALHTQVDKFLLSRMLTLSEFGYFTLASVVASTVFLFLTPVAQAWYPRLSQLYASSDFFGLRNTYHQGAQIVSVTMGTAAIILIIFAEPLLIIWTKDPGLAARVAPLLSVLAFGNLLNGLTRLPYLALNAHGMTALAFWSTSIGVLFLVPVLLLVTPYYGSQGAAWVWVLINIGYLTIGLHFLYKRILKREKWKWYIGDVLAPLICAALIAVITRELLPLPEGTFAQIGLLTIIFFLTMVTATVASSLLRLQLKSVLIRIGFNYRTKYL